MRKLLFILCFVVSGLGLNAQSTSNSEKPSLYFRLGAGYGYRNLEIPVATTADEKNHFENLRNGRSYNFTLGYFVSEDKAVGLVYNRYQTQQSSVAAATTWDSKLSVSFGGITYQQFIPVGVKRDVNFNFLVGPGMLFFRNDYTKANGATRVARFDVNRGVFGAIGGAGLDVKVANGVRWELNATYTIGSINEQGGLKENLNAFTLGTGFRFSFN